MDEEIILKRFYKPSFIFLLHSRLTSPLDLYATLRHILQTFSPSDRGQGQSEGRGQGRGSRSIFISSRFVTREILP